ncbi:MAG: aminotransferase class I/II-fold pyridoxal phosphate-dependent enzyme, partial [Rhodospirillales bacterium]|nr:aminotransferase class I/II-fold pyridoxal phosphate-dependent enzyme [Rhodospirillales bacterium]
MPPSPDNRPFLPYARQCIEDDDIDAVVKVLKSTHLTAGPVTESFEAALAEKTGAAHVISCSSGTAALHLSALALGLGPGDTVIVPTITFLATANAAQYVGADVVFADVDPDTGLMGPDDFLDALERSGNKAKAVFPVHLAGQSPDIETIGNIARENGLAVVEDACHALGTTYTSEPNGLNAQDRTGSCRHGDMAVFSFHPAKTVAMGEGGAITTNDAELADRLRLLRNHGMTRNTSDFKNNDMSFDGTGQANPWYYEMARPGFNYRASEIHCSLGLSQLGKLDRFVERRRELVACYDDRLAPLSPLVRPIHKVP